MLQTAVFVDAGYLFAAGSALLWGEKQPRNVLSLEVTNVLSKLIESAKHVEANARLLRIYWYDGIQQNRGPSPEQTVLGLTPNIKLRLGFVNSQGQQKGVDSLIVTDLIDLARNNAISDALILAGDEDLRVGVQVAQTYGVRVHLIAIKPARSNQSPTLAQESDGILEWSEEKVKEIITRNSSDQADRVPALGKIKAEKGVDWDISETVASIDSRFSAIQKANNQTHTRETGSLPREVDAPLLALARDTLGRDLSQDEKRKLRSLMIATVKAYSG